MIARGAKRVLQRDEICGYDAARFLACSVDLLLSAHVTQGPSLCFRLDLDAGEVAALLPTASPF